ncbi:hypothetical protein AWB77_06258 [Caballeronia fortuita]|uniref:Uncharacterized protein n=1 Tax=Caballeronia fortuita TaxID=1777138 RepID=A0A158E2J7_9BURK|nr:hypothetical protein [Caballeronia fortuita]SAL01044.1 hypothetical protein AWB77_06258 [Caballeronia fortuita]
MKVGPSLAMRTAINALRDIVESERMPNGIPLTDDELELHRLSADELERQLVSLKNLVGRLER